MLDKYVVPVLKPPLRSIARKLHSHGMTADRLTLLGFLSGLLAVLAIASGWYLTGLVFLLANRLADGLDGELARLTEPTDAGAYLDITLDFWWYAMVPLGFAFANPEVNAIPAIVLVTSFVGTGTSFLAYSRYAAIRGVEHPDFGFKGFYYLDGLAEGTETVLVFVAMCLWPGSFRWLAGFFAAVCVVTAINRIYVCYRALQE